MAEIKLRLKEEIGRVHLFPSEEVKFANAVVLYFFRKRSTIYPDMLPSNQEKMKNKYLAKLFYRKLQERDFDYDLSSVEDVDGLIRKLSDSDFWRDKIDFMFGYADEQTLSLYSQTINGAFKFYFRHYDRLKSIVKSRTMTSDEKALLSAVRGWKKQDVVDCFHFYIVKLYRYLYPDFKSKNVQAYYKNVRYIIANSQPPQIQPVVIENNLLLRGLFLQFKPKLVEWSDILGQDLLKIIGFDKIEALCEEKGAVYDEEVTNKDLNDIISDAMSKYAIVED